MQIFTVLIVIAFSAAQSAPIDDTHFLLWTRQNPTAQQELKAGDVANLVASHYDSNKPTKILAHGWRQNGYSSEIVIDMRDAMLDHEDCNFISVDWEKLASNLNYYASAKNVVPVGELTGALVNFLISQGTPSNNFHLIGFSLGAHVVGNAGMDVIGAKLPRITGLDPAFPSFSFEETGNRLDTTDATFVDIIHTNSAGSIAQGGLSFPVPIGHVDFWPNGGEAQPGCALPGPDIIDLATGCSHGRAYEYFIESINSRTQFIAMECESYSDYQNGICRGGAMASMGFPVSTSVAGNFYLKTSNSAPFALGFMKNLRNHPRAFKI